VIGMPIRTEVLMGTLVTIHLVSDADEGAAAIERAFGWFREIEAVCSRFDPGSELMRLCATTGRPVAVSPILFEAVRFALTVAEDTAGAFDPTVGAQMAARGFNRVYRSAGFSYERSAGVQPCPSGRPKGLRYDGSGRPEGLRYEVQHSYRDVRVDDRARTIALDRPLTLDLGAIAKGLAVDAAARELQPFTDFAVDAGGDLYLGGHNPAGAPWSVGIRHPRRDGELIDSLRVSDRAVCTSGDYERPVPDENPVASASQHHVLDPRTGTSPPTIASVTVVAPTAMLADALATAAFVLGPVEGIRLLERHGVEGLIFTPGLERFETTGWRM
jgi:thiamine biosynthesis lipoprotein